MRWDRIKSLGAIAAATFWLATTWTDAIAEEESIPVSSPIHLQRCTEQNHLDSCNKHGWYLHHNGSAEAARPFFRKGCQGGLAKSCNNLGVFQKEAGHLDAAKNLLRKACQLDHARACGHLATIWEEAGDHDLGASYRRLACSKGHRVSCRSHRSYGKVASRRAYQDKKKYSKRARSMKSLKKKLSEAAVKPNSSECAKESALQCISTGKKYESAGDFAEAIAAYQQACSKAEPFGCLSAAEIYGRIENFEYARRHVQRACRYVSEQDCQVFRKNACHSGYGWECGGKKLTH